LVVVVVDSRCMWGLTLNERVVNTDATLTDKVVSKNEERVTKYEKMG